MKIPAIRSRIGNWTYYTAVLSFEKVSQIIQKVDDELHHSESLRDQIQRSITDNFLNIKNYILNQEERFFNSLVLAVYDGQPQWVEVEMNFGDEYYYNMGFLELNGNEKIFPVDGQHRVEGIKAAIAENPELAKEEISILLIGHKKDQEGMQKTRRLFSTLNRYAKPVKLNDIIALDEDDTVAIITRDLLENSKLFTGKRTSLSEQKGISEFDKYSITSIITLYEANQELYKYFIRKKYNINPTKIVLYEKKRYRPNEVELNEFKSLCFNFWRDFEESSEDIKKYISIEIEPAREFRKNITGGNLLFRPIGLFPFIQATIDLSQRTNMEFKEIFKGLNKQNLIINEKPWKNVLWNDVEKTMIMGNRSLTKLLLMYKFKPSVLSNNELQNLKKKYGYLIGKEDDIENCLNEI
jgi:DNA sulfur modification protein DndB